MPQSLSNLIMHLKPYWLDSIQKVGWPTEGPGIDIIGTQVGLGGDTILLYNTDGSPVEEFPATGAGMNQALAAAGSGDLISIPAIAITLSGAITIPTGITVFGMSRLGSVLIGDITINVGTLTNCKVNGHITITGNGNCHYVSATGNSGNIIAVSHGSVLNCEIDMIDGADYGIYATTGTGRSSIAYCRTYRSGGTGNVVGCYLNGAQVRATFCKFTGKVGGVVEACELVSNCYFLGDTGDGLQHTTGTAYITHSTFWSTAGGVGADIDAVINLGNVNWNSVTGDNFITWIPPDDGSSTGGGGGSGSGIFAETGTQVELDGPLAASNDTAGLLEGFRLIGENEAANPVIACGALGSSDNYIREIGNVLYEPNETTRKYKMTYTGYSGTYEGVGANEKIHYAYSEDGKTWTKYASNPVIAARAEDSYLLRVNNTYYLYCEDKQNQGANGRIRRYHSADCIIWTDDGQITGLGNCQSPVVWREGATWYLLYEQWPTAPQNVMLATSSDGLAWTAEATNPVFEPGDTAWATDTVVSDDIFRVGGTYYLSYHGWDGSIFQAGMAKSINLTAWTDLGIVTSADLVDKIQHVQIYYDIRFAALYCSSVSDTTGIYRGYPLAPILTLSSDAITVDGDRYYVAAQTGTTDNLSTINGGVYSQLLVLQADTGDTITVKHNVGNIWINNLSDAVLTGNNSILLFWDGTKWSTDGIQATASLALNDLTDVDTTGTGTGDIIYNDAGTWKDYPLGIGTKVSVTSNKIRFGNSAGGNYLEIDLTTGNLRLVGDATAWDDLRVSASIAKPGVTAPNYKAFGPSGSLQALMFEAGHHDEVYFEIQMPHNWKEGTNIHPHVHWSPTTADAGNVVWELEYSWANINGTFGAPGNMATAATAAGGVAWVHKMSDFLESGNDYIVGTGKTISSMLVCRLHRNSNAGSDTLNKDVALLEFDLHYEVDSFGSDTELVKDTTSSMLIETGDYLLLENGDNLLLE